MERAKSKGSGLSEAMLEKIKRRGLNLQDWSKQDKKHMEQTGTKLQLGAKPT